MFCKQCGKELRDGANFCTNCGAKQTTAAPAPTSTYHSPSPQQPYYQQSAGASGQWAQPGYSSYSPTAGMSNGPVSFGKAVNLFFTNYVDFTGRASRSEYWWGFLFTFLMAFTIVGGIACYIGMLSLTIRRLHDIGKQWTWLLMGLIPYVGAIILIVYYCRESDLDNRWGPAFSPTGAASREDASTQASQNPPAPPASSQISDEEIVKMAHRYAPTEFQSEQAKAMMTQTMMQIVPTYQGAESLSYAISACNKEEIQDRIAAADFNTLMAAFKTLGFQIGQGEDRNILGAVQQSVLRALKKQAGAQR